MKRVHRPETRRRGRFITLEGIEGSGKSTHVAMLADRLESSGYKVVLAREPGGTAVGEQIRRILKRNDSRVSISNETELLLFAASRAELVRSVILPSLQAGMIVICDRFMDSTTAYQGCARGLDMDDVAAVNEMAVGEAVPDLTILLDVGVDEGFRRLAGRSRRTGVEPDRIERAGLRFHREVRRAYLELARLNRQRFKVVKSSSDVEQVSERIWRLVRDVL